MNILFIRTISETHSWQYYDSRTDVLVFADVDGYACLTEMLLKARNWSSNIHLDAPSDSSGMRVVITPVFSGSFARPVLRLIERPVFFAGRPNMELVVCGNGSGYERLAARLTKVMHSPSAGFADHWHLGCEDYIVQPSVGLNARAPLARWHSSSFGEWSVMLNSRQESYMPPSIDYMFAEPCPYEEVDNDDIRAYLKQPDEPKE